MMPAGRLRRRRGSAAHSAVPEALRALAALLRAGAGPRMALINWHCEAPPELSPRLSRVSRRLLLGAPIAGALAGLRAHLGADAAALAGIFVAHERLGGDLARMLDALAARVDQAQAARDSARAASAGAVLSGRIVAGLPFLFLVFAPAGGGRFLDGAGLLMLAFGAALAIGGIVWIEQLVPSPEILDDPVAFVCEVTAGILSGGSGPSGALGVVASHCPESLRPSFSRARRLVRLGAAWSDALMYCGDARLRGLASALRRSETLGVPLARSLDSWAQARRALLQQDFEAAMRRAPVLMVVPLTLCVLPAYLVLGLGPVLRGL